MRKLIIYSLTMLIFCCKNNIDYYKVNSFSDSNNLNAVIEIPAGTNKKYEYKSITKSFEIDKKEGKERIIEFLPYLGNYGFIPSTFSDPKTGGDGDALDILVLSESIETGVVLETIPIAMLKLIDDGEIDYKIIAIPSDKNSQIISVASYNEFSRDFPEIKVMIEMWFLNYNKSDETQIEGWGTEKEALEEIYKNAKH
ncbi:MAG: inorganic pyrophosphatase [Psychroserpens sp.]|jgi:inorganic pyrophosphatase|uniref:inorganic diphosphatase n=1 Tax=Psychroserpens sp. TaxID=2020870 RepID=UPI0039E38824